jgi:oxygen-independent coproporphyrinogen III oxidase
VGGTRWQNVADTGRYIELLAAGQSAALPGEDLTADQRRTERFGLELRTARGLPVPLIQVGSQGMLETLEREGLLRVEEGHVRLTRAGKPLVDSVAVALMG